MVLFGFVLVFEKSSCYRVDVQINYRQHFALHSQFQIKMGKTYKTPLNTPKEQDPNLNVVFYLKILFLLFLLA